MFLLCLFARLLDVVLRLWLIVAIWCALVIRVDCVWVLIFVSCLIALLWVAVLLWVVACCFAWWFVCTCDVVVLGVLMHCC